MQRSRHPAAVLLLGLTAAQIIATLQVHLSNRDLFRTLTAIASAGYLTVPNQQIMHHLRDFTPAFIGGLFFTLTVGAGLSMVALGAFWCWDHLLRRNELVLALYLLFWSECLVIINLDGPAPLVTIYLLAVPLLVAVATLRWTSTDRGERNRFTARVHLIPVVILALCWLPQVWSSPNSSNMFLNIRDNLLLTNPLGTRFNDIYYEYTLYPARILKTVNQRQLRTCDLGTIEDERLKTSLERALIRYDYLSIGDSGHVDLAIKEEDGFLALMHKEKAILKATEEEMLSNPAKVLREFSAAIDNRALLSQVTFYSLLLGFPVALYILIHAAFRLAARLFLNPRHASVAASISCFVVGIALFSSFLLSKGGVAEVDDIAQALASERWQDRVAALKAVAQRKMEIGDSPVYEKLLDSPLIPERYWLAETLAASRIEATYRDLRKLAEDQHPNVVCKALESLSRRGNRDAIGIMLEKVEGSDHWYIQWYAYRALRVLGWKQAS